MSWLPKKVVVVPVDFSPWSFEAVRLARDFVAEPAGLHVIHVIVPGEAMDPAIVWGGITDEDRMKKAMESLEKATAEPQLAGITRVVRAGSPGLEIAKYASEVNAELIVMPSHGHTGLKHLLLGSVTQRVVHRAPCPVLVLRRSD